MNSAQDDLYALSIACNLIIVCVYEYKTLFVSHWTQITMDDIKVYLCLGNHCKSCGNYTQQLERSAINQSIVPIEYF